MKRTIGRRELIRLGVRSLILGALIAISFSLLATGLAVPILESWNHLGLYTGLLLCTLGYLASLLGVPVLLKLKARRSSFYSILAYWTLVQIAAIVVIFPLSDWLKDRGTFVPSLLFGPRSSIVEGVFRRGLGWGDSWKVPPGEKNDPFYQVDHSFKPTEEDLKP